MELTPKQQTSEAIRQAETILITTGQHPSMDQVAAVISLAMILRKFGKKVSAVISDSLPQAASMLEMGTVEKSMSGLRDFVLKVDVSRAEVDKLRYEVADSKLNIYLTPFKGNFAPSDVTFDYGQAQMEYDLAIVLGVPTRARLDRIYEQNQPLFATMPLVNLDFHRSNENYGAVNLIEPNASSLCEMLVALSESLQSGIIDSEIATALLMGIVASTDRFTAAHTTSKSLTVAAQMMAAGARQQAVVKALYRDNRGGDGAARGPERNEQPQRDRGPQRTEPQREQQPREQLPREQRESRTSEQPRVAEQSRPVVTQAPVSEPTQAQVESAVQTVAPVAAPVAPSAEIPPMVAAPHVSEVVPQAAPAMPAVSEQQPVVSEQAPTQDLRPFRANEVDLPIIDPSHIELSEPEGQPDNSDAPTMADFNAAAEALDHRSDETQA